MNRLNYCGIYRRAGINDKTRFEQLVTKFNSHLIQRIYDVFDPLKQSICPEIPVIARDPHSSLLLIKVIAIPKPPPQIRL